MHEPSSKERARCTVPQLPVRVLRRRYPTRRPASPTLPVFTTRFTPPCPCVPPPLTHTHTHTPPPLLRCYVATDASLQQALRLGLAAGQMRMYGLPIRPAFGRSFPAKNKLRK